MFELPAEHMFCIVSNMRSTHTESRTGLRAIVLGLLLVLIIGAFLLLFEEEAVSASGGPQVTSVVVEPGDTLWEIADRVAPEGADLRVVIKELVALNELQSKVLKPGQVLQVPSERL